MNIKFDHGRTERFTFSASEAALFTRDDFFGSQLNHRGVDAVFW